MGRRIGVPMEVLKLKINPDSTFDLALRVSGVRKIYAGRIMAAGDICAYDFPESLRRILRLNPAASQQLTALIGRVRGGEKVSLPLLLKRETASLEQEAA